ncbi:MAG: nucleotidyltransferase domain-containing protein [Armatimonadota bacterium]
MTLEPGALDQIVEQIVKILDPEKVILFGSYACGEAGPDSDVDIAVIAETDEPRGRRTVPLADAWPHVQFPTDIMVFTPGEWEHWATVLNTIPNEASREGSVLYDRTGAEAQVGTGVAW